MKKILLALVLIGCSKQQETFLKVNNNNDFSANTDAWRFIKINNGSSIKMYGKSSQTFSVNGTVNLSVKHPDSDSSYHEYVIVFNKKDKIKEFNINF